MSRIGQLSIIVIGQRDSETARESGLHFVEYIPFVLFRRAQGARGGWILRPNWEGPVIRRKKLKNKRDIESAAVAWGAVGPERIFGVRLRMFGRLAGRPETWT